MSNKESLNPRDGNYVKQVNGQIMLNEEKLTCVVSWSERSVFIKTATREVAKKSKNYEDAATRKKMKMKNHWRLRFPEQECAEESHEARKTRT